MFRGTTRLFVAIGLLVIVGIIASISYARLPHATITITPATSERAVEQTITLSGSATAPDFKRFILPAKVVESESEHTETISRSGGAAREENASGTVRLINDQDTEQPLLPQTHLEHVETGALFLTDNAVRLPPRGSLDVPVTAKEVGAAGNVAAGRWRVQKLPASLQEVVYGESDTATSGGEVFDSPLTEAELNAAKDELRTTALASASGELTAQAGGAPIRADLISTDIVQVSSSAEPGSLATSYTLSATVRQRAFVVDEQDLLSLTLLALRASPEPDEDFTSYVPDSFSAQIVRADFDRAEARVAGKLTGVFTRKTESAVFDTRALFGRTEAETQEHFRQYESVAAVDVALSPFWVSAIPSRDAAIDILVQQQSTPLE